MLDFHPHNLAMSISMGSGDHLPKGDRHPYLPLSAIKTQSLVFAEGYYECRQDNH